ncbi:hypothetical protein Pla22_44370 [Rubripirellula amarantea]|uniref:Helix-turn-helix domain-containing protein n=1 Tax=Rubripirellula amarantea TaxID=2527999 RepID=A0A5C5WGL6_9BACT|nr:hypothetical protein Pla22_44370 [Rubripirellula amarantea]
MITSKKKSTTRFEQMNHLVDEVIQGLSPLQAAALFVCFRHANIQGEFKLSATRLANTLGIGKRTAQRVFDGLQREGALEVIKPQKGTIPRTFWITGRPIRGDTATDPSERKIPCRD